jgi:predicted nucleic acid-binding protein
VKTVLDAWAVVAWATGEQPAAEMVRQLFLENRAQKAELIMNAVNVGEVYYIMCRKKNVRAAQQLISSLDREIRISNVDLDLAMLAGNYKHNNRLSLADAFALATAEREAPALLATGDPEIRAAKLRTGKVQIQWLERNP